MAITYSAVTDTITVTGYTEGTPCTFLDIYNADVSGSWGQITRQCLNQYCANCIIVIGDGSTATWFKDVNAHITFNKDVSGSIVLETKSNSNFQLGECDANDRTSKGCAIYGISTSNSTELKFGGTGNVKLYNFLFNHSDDDYGRLNFDTTGTVEVIDIMAWKCWTSLQFLKTPTAQKLKRITLLGGGSAIGIFYGATITMEDVAVFNAQKPFRVNASTLNATNISFEGETYLAQMQDTATLNMYDCPVSTTNIEDSGSNWVVNEYFHFNLKLVDINEVAINGAKAKIWDIDDTLKVNTTTGSSGSISEQTLDYATRPDTQTRTLKTPHELRMYKYGKEMLSSKTTIEKETDWIFTMYTDDHITQTTEATVAAYTGITINHTTETITISSNHTLDEIYDYCQYDIIAATKQLDQTMHTADGVNFVSEYSFAVVSGITVTATDQKLSVVAGEIYTLIGTAQFTGIIATTTTTRIPIKLTNIIDGSRYWVGKQSDGTKIFEGTQSGSGTVTGYYEHTANIDIDIRTRKSSASVKYKPWIGEGTLVAEAFSLRIRQIQDSIVT